MNIFSKILYSVITFLVISFPASQYYLFTNLLSSAFANENKSDLFTVKFKGEPLKKVLGELSKKSGNSITVNEVWEDWPVTVALTNVTVHRALKQILGKLNHVIVYSGENKIFVTIYGSPEIIASAPKFIDPLDLEVIPQTEPGGKGVTQREINAILAKQKKIDPLDLEVIPPTEPGGKGVTQREINAILAKQKKIDPLDLEVIPPTEPGGKGITQRELDAMKPKTIETSPMDIDVIPPEGPGE